MANPLHPNPVPFPGLPLPEPIPGDPRPFPPIPGDPPVDPEAATGPGPVGYIFHTASKKLIHPSGGSYDPAEGTNIVVYHGSGAPGRLQFRLIPKAGEFGFIEQVSSGKILATPGGTY